MALGFLTNKEAREQISGLETRVSELELEISNAGESLTTAQNELATARESLSEAQGDLVNAKERIAGLETENAKIPDLEAAVEVSREKIANEASVLAASIGLTEPLPDADNSLNADASRTPLMDKFLALKGAEATTFFNAHQKEIAAEQRNSRVS